MKNINRLLINKKFKEDIKILQILNKHYHHSMNKQIDRISSEIGLTSERDREILWDHIYNENSLVKFK